MDIKKLPRWIEKKREEKRLRRFHERVMDVEHSFDEIIGIIRDGYGGHDDEPKEHDGRKQILIDRFIEYYRSYFSQYGKDPTYGDMSGALGITLDEVDEIYSGLLTKKGPDRFHIPR